LLGSTAADPRAEGEGLERLPTRHNLPAPVNSFVGREAELRESARWLATARLVTLTGPGGAGKTRLALEVAASLSTELLPDGIWLVELAELRDASPLADSVASVLGMHQESSTSPRALLLSYLRDRQVLLILDNCEHVVDACGEFVEELLRLCPGVHVLATSTTTLGIAGEVAFPVPSLPVPDDADAVPPTPSEALRFASVRLFVDRARAYSPSFDLTSANVVAVARVCQQLEASHSRSRSPRRVSAYSPWSR